MTKQAIETLFWKQRRHQLPSPDGGALCPKYLLNLGKVLPDIESVMERQS